VRKFWGLPPGSGRLLCGEQKLSEDQQLVVGEEYTLEVSTELLPPRNTVTADFMDIFYFFVKNTVVDLLASSYDKTGQWWLTRDLRLFCLRVLHTMRHSNELESVNFTPLRKLPADAAVDVIDALKRPVDTPPVAVTGTEGVISPRDLVVDVEAYKQEMIRRYELQQKQEAAQATQQGDAAHL